MEKDIILKVENLVKRFGDLVAVDDISFSVRKGQFLAFLGTNGAGKSTTIKILITLLKQNSGSFSVNANTDSHYIRSKIGVVFQENVLDDLLIVKENLFYRGMLFYKNKKEFYNRYNQLKKELFFEEFEDKQFKLLSGGQKRRVEIARALLGNPEILLLDEPTTGLDPEGRRVVWDIIEKLRKSQNITVFLTTHYMEETNNADYVLILHNGKVMAEGSPVELKTKFAKDIFKVVPKNKKLFSEYLEKNNFKHYKIADQFVIDSQGNKHVIETLWQNQDNIKEFEFIKGSMDDVFLSVVGEV